MTDTSTASATIKFCRYRRYRWSRLGLRTIGALIKATLAYNKRRDIVPKSYRDFEGISHQTVRNYANAGIADPQQNGLEPALAHIAPSLYWFEGFGHQGELYFNPSRCYKSWEELADHVGTLTGHHIPEETEIKSFEYDGAIQLALPDTIPLAVIDLIAKQVRQQLMAEFTLPQAKTLSKLSTFLNDWCDLALDEQLERLEIDRSADWPTRRQQIVAALSRLGEMDSSRAESILDGDPLAFDDYLRMSYLFPKAGEPNVPYSQDVWSQFMSKKGAGAIAA